MPDTRCSALLIHRPEYEAYDFGPEHPLRPERMRCGLDLIAAAGLGPEPHERVAPPPASADELRLVHSTDYVLAVQRLSAFAGEPAMRGEARRWGLGEGDCPAFGGMHEASAAIAGGTLYAARAVLAGEADHAFVPAGGLHHALRDRASGFCIYNDLAIAIADALQRREARVLYLDFDVHHGDGVQAAFYDEPRVLTLSFHETGRHLFPGSGYVHELGEGLGRGASLNVPMEPFTEDASWLEALELLVPLVAERFGPDLIVSQHGCDTHAWDPLAHLRLSTRAFAAQARLVHELAHRVCGGRWVATGGGGYDWVRVVPRSWAILWAEMSGRRLPELLPQSWLDRWTPAARANGFWPLPEAFHDEPLAWQPVARRQEIEAANRAVAEQVRRLAAPALLRQAYPAYRVDALPPRLPEVVAETGGAPLESRAATLGTPRGPVELRDLCPASLLERLHPDPGLAAFARHPQAEYALLLKIARDPRCALSLAHTPDGAIVAQITIAAGQDWWAGLRGVYELGIETSKHWRRMGLARALLRFTISAPWIEHLILVGLGLVWNWDLDRQRESEYAYRDMLRRLFESCGFRAAFTSEPNVQMHAANILLVRVGARVPQERVEAFEEALLVRPGLRTK